MIKKTCLVSLNLKNVNLGMQFWKLFVLCSYCFVDDKVMNVFVLFKTKYVTYNYSTSEDLQLFF